MGEDRPDGTSEVVTTDLADVAVHADTVESTEVIAGALQIGAPLAAHRGGASRDEVWVFQFRVDGLQSGDY
jgi:hypothetical protein